MVITKDDNFEPHCVVQEYTVCVEMWLSYSFTRVMFVVGGVSICGQVYEHLQELPHFNIWVEVEGRFQIYKRGQTLYCVFFNVMIRCYMGLCSLDVYVFPFVKTLVQ